jgi:hypothetical protein
LTVGPNVNTGPRLGNQNEAAIAINPNNIKNLVVFSNDETVKSGLFMSVSMDGGTTWKQKVIFTLGPKRACCDGQATFDQFGNLFVTYVTTDGGIAVGISTNGGATFKTRLIAPNNEAEHDQPSVAVGPGLNGTGGSVWVSYFNDKLKEIVAQGAAVRGLGRVNAFGAAEVALGSGEAAGQFGDVAIGPDGQVMVTYQGGLGDAGNEGPSNIFYNVDADGLGPGGFTERAEVTETQVGQMRVIPPQSDSAGIDAEANLAWALSGAHKGRIYIVYVSAPNPEVNNTDIYVKFSDDNGATWSARHRVNDSRVRSRFLPSITIDQTSGNVAVAWYDSRNATANRNAELFASASIDGGVTWLPNVKVSAGMSNANKSEPAQGDNRDVGYGDFIKSASFSNGVFYPVWADNSNSTKNNPNGKFSRLDIYTAKVTLKLPAPTDEGLASAPDSGSDGTASGLVEDTSLAATLLGATHTLGMGFGSDFLVASRTPPAAFLTEGEAVALAGAATQFRDAAFTETTARSAAVTTVGSEAGHGASVFGVLGDGIDGEAGSW